MKYTKNITIFIMFFILCLPVNAAVIYQQDFETDIKQKCPSGYPTGSCIGPMYCWVETSSITYPERDATLDITDTLAYSGIKSAAINYKIATSTAVHLSLDNNTSLSYKLPQPKDHLFVQWSLYIPANTSYAGTTDWIQRKLIYIKSEGWGTDNTNAWAAVLTSESHPDHSPLANFLRLRLAYGRNGATEYSVWGGYGPNNSRGWLTDGIDGDKNAFDLQFGQWHIIKMEIKNTSAPDIDDGLVKIWWDKQKIFERADLDLRDYAYSINSVTIGQQINRYSGDGIDEWRYIDDIIIADNDPDSNTPAYSLNDFANFYDKWHTSDTTYDLNKDGMVNSRDLALMMKSFSL